MFDETVVITWNADGTYGYETSYTVTDSMGNEVASGAETDAEFGCDPDCAFTLTLLDSYGDGWNGNVVEVSVNGGDATTFTLDDGSEGSFALPGVGDGDVITITYVASGTYGYETSYVVTDASGNEVASGAESDATVSCTLAAGVSEVMAVVTGEYSGTAMFDFMMSNFTVGVAGEGDGHIHYMINGGDAVMLYETSLTLSNLPDGTHTLTAMVVDDAHQPIEGALSASVEFTIATLACATEVSYDYGTGSGGGSSFDDNFTTGSASEIYSTTYNEGGSVTVNLGGTTENNYDWIYVTNGSGEVLLAPVSGTIDYQVTSDDGVLNVHFSSDGSVTSGPFTIETICGGLSTEDNNILDMTVYPNPVENGMVSILTPVDGEKFIELYSVTGRKVLETTIVGNTLDVSSITSGFYMLKVTVDGQSNVSKLVVR